MSIIQIQRRQREIGRLRLGEKAVASSGKPYPKSLDTWRLTSPNRQLLEAAVAAYGGVVEPWEQQFQVVTTMATLPVMVPPQSIRQDMELWSKGGLVRRCDGETARITTDKEGTVVEQPCVCAHVDADSDEPTCKPSTLLKFWLPDLPGLGVWVLSSTGWNVASELAADVELLAGKNVRASLTIDHRERKVAGQSKRFVVPVLEIPLSLSELLGSENVSLPTSVAAPPVAALPVKETVPPMPPPSHGSKATPTPVGSVADDGLLMRVEQQAWDTLSGLLDEGTPAASLTMDEMERKLRLLFRSLGNTGLVSEPEKALHAGLAKRGAKHVSELRKAELAGFCEDAWIWAQGLVDGSRKADGEQG